MEINPYGKIKETTSCRKKSQFPDQGAPDKINRGGLFAVTRDSSKISALMPQEHQIRMRSDERYKAMFMLYQTAFRGSTKGRHRGIV